MTERTTNAPAVDLDALDAALDAHPDLNDATSHNEVRALVSFARLARAAARDVVPLDEAQRAAMVERVRAALNEGQDVEPCVALAQWLSERPTVDEAARHVLACPACQEFGLFAILLPIRDFPAFTDDVRDLVHLHATTPPTRPWQ